MWSRKELKKKARILIKSNYWRSISVCFLIAMLTASYPISRSLFLNYFPDKIQTKAELILPAFISAESLSSAFLDFIPDNFVVASFLHTIQNSLKRPDFIVTSFLTLGVIFSLLYKFFISNLLIVGEKRFFVESYNYEDTNISKIFFLYKLRYLANPSWVMFCYTLFQKLWDLTIIGGIIKHYEYSMIPYILAENPKISQKNAFFLSKQLTKGNKWKLFLLDCSFLGWELLSLFTLGILDILYVRPYKMNCKASLYLFLRRNYVLSRAPKYEQLNDSYLEHVPSEDELLISKALYDDSEGPYTKISYFAPHQYPVFLFSVQPPIAAVKSPVNPAQNYDFLSCVFLFHAFSIFGWLLEIISELLSCGTLENVTLRTLPWLPLYGICGLLILLLLKKYIKKPATMFIINFIVYTVLDYLIQLFLDLGFGIELPKYHSYLAFMNGEAYLGDGAVFALLGCAFFYYFAPRWNSLFMKLKKWMRISICILLTAIFVFDFLSCVFLFHAFSIFGWLLEIISELLSCGTLENVTLKTLPWLPLYGICGLLILLLLKKYIKKPATMFIINFVVYTALDYLVQLLLDFGFGIELPKYHSYLTFMNGEAYLGDGAVFALLGCAFFYYFAPRWNSLFLKLKKWMRISICILLTAIFVFDLLSGIIQY